MKKIAIILILVLLIFVTASITKPSENNFENYLKQSFVQNKSDDLFTKGVKSLVKIQSNWSIKYEDRIFFAKASTKVVNEKIEFIGIFGFWIQQ